MDGSNSGKVPEVTVELDGLEVDVSEDYHEGYYGWGTLKVGVNAHGKTRADAMRNVLDEVNRLAERLEVRKSHLDAKVDYTTYEDAVYVKNGSE